MPTPMRTKRIQVPGILLRSTPDILASPQSPLGYLREKTVATERNSGARLPDLPEWGTEGRARARRVRRVPKMPGIPGDEM